MIKRKMYKYLINWKQKKDKSALIIKGARQVGKSYLVREFGRNEYESYIEINFLKNPLYKNIFKGDLSAEEIFKRLSAYIPNLKIIPFKTLLFLDEIQVCAEARTAVKFLVEDGSVDVISS